MSWKKVKLGDICIIEKGAIGIQKAIPGEYPLVVTSEERKSHNEYQFDCEAVIIPLVSGTGHGHASIKRIHFQTGKFALGNILCAVIPKDSNQLKSEYLFRFLDLNKENELVARMKGMANVTLPIKEIAQIEIPLPSIEEQVEFVETYKVLETKSNSLSNELSHQLTLVKKLRQSFLQEAVQGKLVAQNPDDEPASELLKKIKAEKEKLIAEKKLKKDKALPPIQAEEIPFEIPEGWVWCRLGEIVEIVRGSSPRPKGDPQYWSKITTPYHWITIADFTPYEKNGILTNTKGFLTEEGSKKSRIVKKGDLLIACSGVGSVGRSIQTGINGFIYDGLLAIRNIESETMKLMIQQFLKFKEEQIYSVASGANWLNINIEVLSNYVFPLPPLSEQSRIVQKLDELMQTCDELEASIKESQAQNEKLLQQVLREALRE
jgi:type I restriction enzyme S subunit